MQGIITIFRKEVGTFFNTLIAYVVLIVFLTGVGLFFWAFDFSILTPGNAFATLEDLFIYSPYLYLLLAPAVTMRAFSEEFRMGTYELLSSKPLSDWQIVLGKYLAAIFLVLFSLVPTLLYYGSVAWLSEPVGNMDHGATIGAYFGLLFLGAIFASLGIFTSSLSDNQIVAFILGVFLCFISYQAFEWLAGLRALGWLQTLLINLSVSTHYQSISRGVIDTRDLVYFFSFIAVVLYLTHEALCRRRSVQRDNSNKNLIWIGAILLFNIVTANYFMRWDLTQEKRFSLSGISKESMRSLSYPLNVTVFLEGDFPLQIKRFQDGIRNTLEELSYYAEDDLYINYIDPGEDAAARDSLRKLGFQPVAVNVQTSSTELTRKAMYPIVYLEYGNRGRYLDLVRDYMLPNGEIDLISAEANLEYKLVSSIRALLRERPLTLAFLQGHGELPLDRLPVELGQELYNVYELGVIDPSQTPGRSIDSLVDMLLIIQPTRAFSERDKYELDQYLLRGGKIVWIMDLQEVDLDVFEKKATLTRLRELNLDDFFMQYGIKLNYDLLLDANMEKVEFIQEGGGFVSQPWPYHILLRELPAHPVARNVEAILLRYAASIDTFTQEGVRKEVFLQGSSLSRSVANVQYIDVNTVLQALRDPGFFRPGKPYIMGALAQGRFTSLFKGRRIPDADSIAPRFPFVGENTRTRPGSLALISDGDFVMGAYFRGKRSQIPYDNSAMTLNLLDYLNGDKALTEIRAKEVFLRPLNKEKVNTYANWIKGLNLILPPCIIILFGVIRYFIRKKEYTLQANE